MADEETRKKMIEALEARRSPHAQKGRNPATEILGNNPCKCKRSGLDVGGVSPLDRFAQIIFVAVLHQGGQFRGRVPFPNGHPLESPRATILGKWLCVSLL